MACSDWTTITQALQDNAFWDTIYCFFVDQMGVPVVSLLFFGSIGMAMTAYYQSPIPVLVAVLIIGSVSVAYLPPGAVTIAAAVLVIAIGGVIAVIYRRIRTP